MVFMIKLSDRKRSILLLVVREYIETAQPVSSSHLVRNCRLGLSPATIRAEFSALTEMGLLRQPHTSAGRIPTEEGYRLFINEIIPRAELGDVDKSDIREQFDASHADVSEWMQLAARVLASHSSAVSMITAPRATRNRLKHVELLSISGRQIFMVLVLIGGEVAQQYGSLSEPIGQERLSDVAKRLNQACAGKTAEKLLTALPAFDPLEADILEMVVAEIQRVDANGVGKLYYDGLSNMSKAPEVFDTNAVYKTIDMLDTGSSIGKMMGASAEQMSAPGTVQVLVGMENELNSLKDFSMVFSNYGIPGKFAGSLGVFGPMRMPYNRAIPTVRYIAGILSDILANNYVE